MHHTNTSLRLSQAEPHDEYQYRIGEAIEQSIDLVAASMPIETPTDTPAAIETPAPTRASISPGS